MTSRTAMTMPHTEHRKHIVVSCGEFASAISMQGHNARLEIWLAGWHIEVYKAPRVLSNAIIRVIGAHRTGAMRRGVTRGYDKPVARQPLTPPGGQLDV
jgi:hypothetical protein